MKSAVDVVVPVFNEEERLPEGMMILSRFLQERMTEHHWRIVIADNGSTDSTPSVSEMLAQRYPGITYTYIPQKGRGRAIRTAWLQSNADIVSYMDVDISTSLNQFPRLVRAVERDYHIAMGSRFARGADVKRSMKREVVSRSYSLMIKSLFFLPFNDYQCGFKAFRRDAAQALLPLVKNDHWFFDTELLIIAAKAGYRIREIPVQWVEDRRSKVRVVSTAWEDVRGLMRLRLGGVPKVPGAPGRGKRRP